MLEENWVNDKTKSRLGLEGWSDGLIPTVPHSCTSVSKTVQCLPYHFRVPLPRKASPLIALPTV